MTLLEFLYKHTFVKQWSAWRYFDHETGELKYYTVECRINKTKYLPQISYRQHLHPSALTLSYGGDDLSFLKPMFRRMASIIDEALEEHIARL